MNRVLTQACGVTGLLFAAAGLTISTADTGPEATEQRQVSDDTLKTRIEHRLETDPMVRRFDIEVRVNGGRATLEGSVATEAQKAAAGTIAAIDGVGALVNQLTVDPDAAKTLADRAKRGMRRTGSTSSDAWITTKVHWFFMGEPSLDDSRIEVDTKKRVVTLKGTVTSAAGRARAVELAGYADSVTKVVDNLTVTD